MSRKVCRLKSSEDIRVVSEPLNDDIVSYISSCMENPDALDEKVSEAKSLPKSSELFELCLTVGLAYTGTYLAAFMGLDDFFECSDLCPKTVDCKLATFIGTTGKSYLGGSNHGQPLKSHWSVKNLATSYNFEGEEKILGSSVYDSDNECRNPGTFIPKGLIKESKVGSISECAKLHTLF